MRTPVSQWVGVYLHQPLTDPQLLEVDTRLQTRDVGELLIDNPQLSEGWEEQHCTRRNVWATKEK